MSKLLFSSIIVLMMGCAARIPYSVKKKMTYQLPVDTNESELSEIRFDGFYQMFDKRVKYYGYNPQYKVDSTPIYFMFFKDGLFAYNFHSKEEPNDSVFNSNKFHNLKDGSLDANFWGIFERKGDSFAVQILHKAGSSNDSWRLRGLSFKILKDSTLLLGKNVDLLDSGINFTEDSIDLYSTAHFIKAINLPSSKSWLKKEKWLWRNPEDWKKYMESIGKKAK